MPELSQTTSTTMIDSKMVSQTIQDGFPSLKFPLPIERAFDLVRYDTLIKRAPIISLYAVVMLLLYSLSDFVFLPESVHVISIGIRLFVVVPALIFIVWCSYRKWPYSIYQVLYTGTYCIAGLAVVTIIMVARIQHVPMPYEGLLLIVFLGYLIIGIPFFHALVVSVGLSFLYIGVEIAVDYPTRDLAYNAFFVLTSNAIGAVGCYMHERTQRLAFLNQLLVERSRDEAERENESKTKLLAVASHDLRQPLHAMTLFAENLENALVDAESKAKAQHIQASIRHLNQLLSSLLDMSRLQYGVVKPHLKGFDLLSLVEQVVRESHHGHVLMEIEGHKKGAWVKSDALIVARILRNLIDNALEHAQPTCVSIAFRNEKDHVTLSVTDNGVGISHQDIERIFEQFQQVKDRPKAGLGLGLSIVKQMSQLIGAELSVRSEIGQGTTFELVLPAFDRALDLSEMPSAHDIEKVHQKRVLIAEDAPDVLTASSEMIRSWGYQVEAVASVEEAVQVLHDQSFDLIITDYHFAGQKDGIDLVRWMRAQNLSWPAIILTADTQIEFDETAMSPTVVAFKPIKPAKLKVMIRQLL